MFYFQIPWKNLISRSPHSQGVRFEIHSSLVLTEVLYTASELESSDTGLLRPGWASGREKSEDSPNFLLYRYRTRCCRVAGGVESSSSCFLALSCFLAVTCGVNGFLFRFFFCLFWPFNLLAKDLGQSLKRWVDSPQRLHFLPLGHSS